MNLISLIFVKLSSASVSCGHFSFFQYWRYYLLYRQKVQPSCYFCSDDKDLDLGCFYSSKIKIFPQISEIVFAILLKYSANPWSLLHIYGHINVIFMFHYRNPPLRGPLNSGWQILQFYWYLGNCWPRKIKLEYWIVYI